MATPGGIMTLRRIVYIVVLFVMLFLFNKLVVMRFFTDVWRSKYLRFQTSCFLQSVYSLIAVYVWCNLSRILDKEKTGENDSFRSYLSLRSSSFESKLWKVSLAVILISMCGIYPTFTFFTSTRTYMISFWIGLCWAMNVLLFTGVLSVKIICLIARLTKHKIRNAVVAKIYVAIIITSMMATMAGFYNAVQPPQIKEVQIPVKQLPAKLDGMTITLITDMHLGPTAGREHFEKVVHIANYLQSDMVIIGGDLVDGRVDQTAGSIEPLEWLDPEYGVFFVTGNHEYYTTDVHNWFVELEAKGVKILHNSHVWLPSSDNKGLCLAGVDDPQGDAYKFMDHTMDLDKALTPCGDTQPVILVSHRPAGAKVAFNSGHRVDLVLSGHTHGGQMFPISLGAYFGNPYYAGLYKHGDSSHVYVSMGTRFWGFPVRIGTRSEITKITLKSAQ